MQTFSKVSKEIILNNEEKVFLSPEMKPENLNEISLSGKVMKIGGVKEKIMAAKREGMKILIFQQKE